MPEYKSHPTGIVFEVVNESYTTKAAYPTANLSTVDLRPQLVQAFDAHRLRRAQFLGKKADAQFFQQPAQFLRNRDLTPIACADPARCPGCVAYQAEKLLFSRISMCKAFKAARRANAGLQEAWSGTVHSAG